MAKSLVFCVTLISYCLCVSSLKDSEHVGKAVTWTLEDAGGIVTPSYRTQTTDTTQLSGYLKDEIKSKEMFVIVKKEDKSSPLTVPYIANSIKSSSQAVIIPHLYAVDASSAKRSLVEHLEGNGVVQNVKHVSLTQLHEIVVGSSSPLKNGQLDTYVVTVSGDASEESEFKAISKAARSSAVMIMVAEDPSAIAPTEHAQYSRVLTSPFYKHPNVTWEGGEFSIYYQGKYLYMTPDILTGVMTGLFFFFALLIGFNCLGAIQGPSTFANKLPPLGKEA